MFTNIRIDENFKFVSQEMLRVADLFANQYCFKQQSWEHLAAV